MTEKLIFEYSQPGRRADAQMPAASAARNIPANLRRQTRALLPEVSELQAVRHFTRLSQLNFSIDTHFYPLGSCTMKYNPRACNQYAMLPEFLSRHPHAPESMGQGFLACFYELQEMLKEVTGMQGVSLTPMAGAQGEFAGVAMIRAYHESRKDDARVEILIPNAAHGTNPATATMCGYAVREVPVKADGDVDVEALRAAVGPHTAGLMMTNPSTCGVFDRKIAEIAKIVHGAGGLLYYDGANLNAILGKAKPGDMGFDVLHMNLHKTFATPHGGGGPGAGPVGVKAHLEPFLPVPVVTKDGDEYALDWKRPQSIGKLQAFWGNFGMLVRAYTYIRTMGPDGLRSVSDNAILNANYIMKRLEKDYDIAVPGPCMHECVLSARRQKKLGITATDIAKRLLDLGFYAPSTYFPLIVEEALMIEPTETEAKETLDAFCDAMIQIARETETNAAVIHDAPVTTPVRRLDQTKAAREPNLRWTPRA